MKCFSINIFEHSIYSLSNYFYFNSRFYFDLQILLPIKVEGENFYWTVKKKYDSESGGRKKCLGNVGLLHEIYILDLVLSYEFALNLIALFCCVSFSHQEKNK